MAVLPSVRLQLVVRLLVCGILFSLLAGTASYFVEMERLDDVVHHLANRQAVDLVHSFEHVEVRSDIPPVELEGFVYATLVTEDGKRIFEETKRNMPPTLHMHLQSLMAEIGLGERHINFRHDGQLFMFLSFDLQPRKNRFSGLYQVDERLDKALSRKVFWSTAVVFLSVLLSTGALVPVFLLLERKVIGHARDAIDANVDALVTLGSAIAQRDSDTDAHNHRVTLYAIRLAEHLGLKGDGICQLVRGAFLHDVGKIGIPDAILMKPSGLTPDEFAIMKSHVHKGLEIVRGSHWLASATEVIGGHHEKFDGTGYPNGVAGDSIPLVARIFAVVDVFDALTSKRPYKEPFSLQQATEILLKGRGTHFDPGVLDSFLQISAVLHGRYCGQDEDCAKHDLERELQILFA